MTCFRLLCSPIRLWSAAGPFLSMVLYFYCLARFSTLLSMVFVFSYCSGHSCSLSPPFMDFAIAFPAVATSTTSPGDASSL